MNPLSRSLISTAQVVCGEYTTAMPSLHLAALDHASTTSSVRSMNCPQPSRLQIVVLESNPHVVFPSEPSAGRAKRTTHRLEDDLLVPNRERGGVRAARRRRSLQACGLTVRQ